MVQKNIAMAKTLKDKMASLSPALRQKIAEMTEGLVAGEKSLRDLRQALALTQEHMAKVLGVAPTAGALRRECLKDVCRTGGGTCLPGRMGRGPFRSSFSGCKVCGFPLPDPPAVGKARDARREGRFDRKPRMARTPRPPRGDQ